MRPERTHMEHQENLTCNRYSRNPNLISMQANQNARSVMPLSMPPGKARITQGSRCCCHNPTKAAAKIAITPTRPFHLSRVKPAMDLREHMQCIRNQRYVLTAVCVRSESVAFAVIQGQPTRGLISRWIIPGLNTTTLDLT